MVSSLDIEGALERNWDQITTGWGVGAEGGLAAGNKEDSLMEDVFDAAFVKKLRWANVPNAYLSGGTALRLVLALSFDFFNPYHNKQAGKHCSIGVIQFVCLNLPPEERHRPGNTYLAAVIPGPREPDVAQIHQYIKPVVSDLMKFWRGVFFLSTAKFPKGRVVQCALGPIVCDIPAARKLCGFKSVNSRHVCHTCDLVVEHSKQNQGIASRHEDDGIGSNTAQQAWNNDFGCNDATLVDTPEILLETGNLRNVITLQEQAAQYVEARRRGHAEGERLSKLNGARWSELYLLAPLGCYNPAMQVVVDPMHNLHLGLAQHHFRVLWKLLEDSVSKRAGPYDADWHAKTTISLKKLGKELKKGASASLTSAPKTVLKAFVAFNSIKYPEGASKGQLEEKITVWVRQFIIVSLRLGMLTWIYALHHAHVVRWRKTTSKTPISPPPTM